MMYRIKQPLLVLFLVLCVSNLYPQDAGSEVVKSFLRTVADKSVSSNIIYDSLLCKSRKELKPEQKRIILEQLDDLRKRIISGNVNSYKLLKYKQLPDAEQNILIDAEDANNTYVVKRNDKELAVILISGNKIRSFVTFNKGKFRTFWLLC